MFSKKLKLSALCLMLVSCGEGLTDKRDSSFYTNTESEAMYLNKFETANLRGSEKAELLSRIDAFYSNYKNKEAALEIFEYINSLDLNSQSENAAEFEVFYNLVSSLQYKSLNEFRENLTDIIASLYHTSKISETPASFSLSDNGSESWCVADGATSSEQFGPYEVETTTLDRTVIVKPKNVPEGCKLPVVHFSNGTGAQCSFYAEITEQIASHGFIVSCYKSMNTGSGNACIKGLEAVYKHFPEISADLVGSTGHSQGGGASVTCAYHAEQKWGESKKYATSAIQPAHGMGRFGYAREYAQIKSPVFMMNGDRDILVPGFWVRSGFNALSSEVHWYQANGAGHMRPHTWARSSTLLFFKWKLLGDEAAKDAFLSLPESSYWSLKATK